ncbi:unnamed protein product, partial [Meganyctiphanes norvegica]
MNDVDDKTINLNYALDDDEDDNDDDDDGKVRENKNNILVKTMFLMEQHSSKTILKMYGNSLIRLVVEEGLNQIPWSPRSVTTPTGCQYDGVQFHRGTCGVSIVGAGDAMEQGLRQCCKSIIIGKLLIEHDPGSNEATVVFAKFPEDITFRKVMLLSPIISSGDTVIKAVEVLKDYGVPENNVILLNLFMTDVAVRTLSQSFPKMTILTSEVHPTAPRHFEERYFGVGAS